MVINFFTMTNAFNNFGSPDENFIKLFYGVFNLIKDFIRILPDNPILSLALIIPIILRIILFFLDKKEEEKEAVKNKLAITNKSEIKSPSEIANELNITKSTKWEDVEIRFKNNYDVKITANNKSYDSDYEKMGFADKRKNKDTKTKESWNLLLLFSVNNNIFPFSDLNIIKKVKQKKQKQELNKLLKAYFGIADDPIVHNKITKNYEMKIKLIPIEDFRQQWADRNIKTGNQETGELY